MDVLADPGNIISIIDEADYLSPEQRTRLRGEMIDYLKVLDDEIEESDFAPYEE